MKIEFKDLGTHKFTKIVEIVSWEGLTDILDFMAAECDPHLPEKGDFELVPIDGQAPLIADKYTVVHTDTGYVPRSMGTVIVHA